MKYYKFFVDCSHLIFNLFLPRFLFSILTFIKFLIYPRLLYFNPSWNLSYNGNCFQLGIPIWNFNPGWKSRYNPPLRWNEIAPEMQGFYFLVKFGLVIVYILKVCRKKSSSILLRKNIFNSSLLAFFFWKVCTFSNFERFLCWKPRNYSQHFSLEILFWDLFISNH